MLCERRCSNYACQAVHTAGAVDETGISLPLTHSTLTGCLDEFFFREVITGVNCDKCNQEGDHQRVKTIDALPEILIIQFNRFSNNGLTTTKNSRVVTYPANLDMTPYADDDVTRGGKTFHYTLQGVVMHTGSLNGGHYKAYCRGPNGVGEFEDSFVTEPPHEKQQVLDQRMLAPPKGWTPYILVYIKKP